MRITSFSRLRGSVALAAMIPALALAGCNRAAETPGGNAQASYVLPELPATLPLSTGAATPVRYAPEASELPDAAPIRTVRTADPDAGYAYADAAYGFSDALGDAPPDYGFEYGADGYGDDSGSDPWAWQGYDDSLAFAEPVSDGYRTYYYRPGAEQPYFVRDPYYGYGYDDGQLAVIYAADGGIVSYSDYGPRIVYAARYLARGRDLYRASRERRRPIIAANWAGRRPALIQYRQSWSQARVRQPQWAAYHQRVAPRAQQHWQNEAIRRQADSRRYANWQAQDFRTPPPPRAIPANWSRAEWAQDRRRFAPVQADAGRNSQRTAAPERRRDGTKPRDDRATAQQRQQAQAERQRPGTARTDPRAGRDAGRDQAQPDRQAQAGRQPRRDAEPAQRVQERQAQAAQRAQRDATGERQTAERARREQTRATQAAQRQQAPAARTQRNERPPADQARATQQAQRAQRQQAQQLQQSQAGQRAQRDQAQQTRAAQQAERGQRQQAQQAQQAQAAQREQARAAQQAQRGQQQQAAQAAQQAQRQQAQAARQQQGQVQQPGQAQPQRQAERQAGREARGPRRER